MRRGSTAVLALFFLAAAAPRPATAVEETFPGEREMIRRLGRRERLVFFGLQYLLNPHQRRQLLSIEDPRERHEWIETFWLYNDPTPATERNEKREEHERRVAMARRLFKKKTEPGWDRRGEMLIRFGMPRFRSKEPGTITFSGEYPPAEFWFYPSLDMAITFQDVMLNGEYVLAIEKIGRSSREELDRLKAINDVYKYDVLEFIDTREWEDEEELKDILSFNPDDIDYVADPDLRAQAPKDLLAEWDREKRARSARNFFKYDREYKSIYSFDLEERLLPVYFDVTSFRGGPGSIRTEVNVQVPTAEMSFDTTGGVRRGRIDLRVLARDIEMNPVARAVDSVIVTASIDTTSQPALVPGQATLTLPPGYYRLGIEAVDARTGRRGVYTTNLELEPMDDRLALSDIMFASRITETGENPRFVKGNLQVIPHPLHAYRPPWPLTFYFEVSGLDTDADGLSWYEIEYRIVPLEGRRRGPVYEEPPPAISSSFRTSGYGASQAQRLEIATDNLSPGSFELIVTVRDRRTMASVEQRGRFSILE